MDCMLLGEKRNEVPKRTSLCTNFNDKKNGNIRSEMRIITE